MSAPLLLGIDIGSSAVKAALFTLAGDPVRAERVPCDSSGEVDPEAWWKAVLAAIAAVKAEKLAAVGLCGRGGTCVLLDERGRVLGPSWHDGREAANARAIRTANAGLSPQAVALLAKAAWWEQENGRRPAAACSAKDFVTWRLTGELVSDPASGGAPPGLAGPVPAARDPWSLAGRIRAACGTLPAGTPVAVGWHDGAAAAFGAGAAADSTAPVTLGTTAVYRVVARTLPPGLRKYWDLTPGLTVTGGDITGAGRAYAWARAVLRDADAARSQPGARGLTFLPQFSGRLAPTRDPDARGLWWGLDGSQSADDLLRAVVEGTAFSLRQVRDWLASHGLAAMRVVTTGGGSRNPIQVQALADALAAPVATTGVEEGCRGAALLAAVAAGLMTLEDARLLQPAYCTLQPDAANAGASEAAYARFLAVQAATSRAGGGSGP